VPARKSEILDHATRLFGERGYEGTSMGDLAERVGVRKASLFYHFPSKEALYEAVMARLVAAVGEQIATALAEDGSFEARLDALSDAITVVLSAQPYAARILIREAMDDGPVMKATLGDSVLTVLGVATEFVRAGQKAGIFVDGDARQVIVTLIGVHFMPFGIGSVVERYTGASPFTEAWVASRRDAVRAQVRRLLLRTP
jgi:AcrR family transcriptional regulator